MKESLGLECLFAPDADSVSGSVTLPVLRSASENTGVVQDDPRRRTKAKPRLLGWCTGPSPVLDDLWGTAGGDRLGVRAQGADFRNTTSCVFQRIPDSETREPPGVSQREHWCPGGAQGLSSRAQRMRPLHPPHHLPHRPGPGASGQGCLSPAEQTDAQRRLLGNGALGEEPGTVQAANVIAAAVPTKRGEGEQSLGVGPMAWALGLSPRATGWD